MQKTLTRMFIVALATLIAVHSQSHAYAQSQSKGSGSQSRGSGSSTKKKMTHDEFQAAFWKYLSKENTGYKTWAPFPGKAKGIYEGQSPHGAFLKMYANSIAKSDPKALPTGSIIVKENYGKDKKTLMAITVMYRTAGYDRKHYDWYWIKYLPNGTTARTPKEKGSMPIAGRFPSCIACHENSDGEDYSYANDE